MKQRATVAVFKALGCDGRIHSGTHLPDHSEPTASRLESARAYLSLFRAYCTGEVAEVTEWDPSRMVEITARAAFVRQFEALESMVILADSNGAAPAPLLRPACEEMIVLEYLTQISPDQAERLVYLLCLLEVGDDLRAQRDYVGDDGVMLSIGFSAAFLGRAESRSEQARADLKKMALELGWSDCRPRLNIRMLAEMTSPSRLDLYSFLYHASSRFVHFKVKELMRRGWSRDGAFTISSDHFRDHWLDFSLYWGIFIHVHTALAVFTLVPGVGVSEQLDDEAVLDVLKMLGGGPTGHAR